MAYHHRPDGDVYTFKQQYEQIFTASGLYRQVALLETDHGTGSFDATTADHERGAVSLLRKSLTGQYLAQPRS